MLKIDLASRVKRPSRRPIALANIAPTKAQASNLAAIYMRVVRGWSERQTAIVAEYERTLAALVTDSIGSAMDNLADEITRLVLTLTPDLRAWALGVERVQRGKWVRSVLSATDVDLSTMLIAGDAEETLGASLEWNMALIRDVSEELRRRISNIVFSGYQQRKSAVDIAREIREAIGMARARALRIAADQTVKLGARLNRARQEQAGLTSFKWRHSGKMHPRPWHKARDGKIYSWRSNSIPADDMPGVPPFCGCTAQGVVTFE